MAPGRRADHLSRRRRSARFARICDERLLELPGQPDFPRRLPWLAADAGCEERAEAANYYFNLWSYPTP
ncbi:hypothetical protein [Sorangium sp. So ce542]|uniref:hypothetical protein n=1 Tax=Sorangium sp. So ce542 TaxID=3133316 RepID=UPI003F5E40A3